jgi:protein-S-isoprenylcysteine O-methyltransferase Ste14
MSDHADVKILPPLIPISFLGIGLVLDLAFPHPIADGLFVAPLGWAAIVASVVLAASATVRLRRSGTAFDVRRPTTRLVDHGIYRISRNPIYLSMMLLVVGIALAANSLVILICVLPAGSALCVLVIRREERYLRRKFGDHYSDYMRRVRRWI